MSADVWLEDDAGHQLGDDVRCSVCGDDDPVTLIRAPGRAAEHAWNLTYNLTPMLAAAGMPPWREQIGMRAVDLAPAIRETVHALLAGPGVFAEHAPPNRWGTWDGAVEVMSSYCVGLHRHPDAVIGGWL